jgi:hypothetical protein
MQVVKDYYGKLLKSSKDLKNIGLLRQRRAPHLQPLLANVHPEVAAKYYGCSIVVPALQAAACSISAQAQGATPTFWRSSSALSARSSASTRPTSSSKPRFPKRPTR